MKKSIILIAAVIVGLALIQSCNHPAETNDENNGSVIVSDTVNSIDTVGTQENIKGSTTVK